MKKPPPKRTKKVYCHGELTYATRRNGYWHCTCGEVLPFLIEPPLFTDSSIELDYLIKTQHLDSYLNPLNVQLDENTNRGIFPSDD